MPTELHLSGSIRSIAYVMLSVKLGKNNSVIAKLSNDMYQYL